METFEQKTLGVSSVLIYLSSLVLLWFDTSLTYRWVTFYLHILSLVCLCLLWYQDIHQNFVKTLNRLKKSTFLPILIVFILTLVASLSFLKSYPFVSLGDEVRDGGLQAQQIATGSLTRDT